MDIKIVGEKRLYDHNEVKNLVVNIGHRYYWKDDGGLIKVRTSKGFRYRRENSPLIRVLDYNRKHADISDIVMSKSGMELNKADPKVVYVSNDWTLKGFCTEIDGELLIINNKNSVKTLSGKWVDRGAAVLLSEKAYGKGKYGLKEECINDFSGEWIHRRNAQRFMDTEGSISYLSTRKDINGTFASRRMVFEKYSEHNSGNLGRVQEIPMLGTKHMLNKVLIRIEDDFGNSYYIHKNHRDEIVRLHHTYINSVIRDSTNKIRERMNKNYSDSGDDENNAKEINLDYGTMPGGHVYHSNERRFVSSISKSKTGGIGYSFGVEFETSAGQLTNKNCSLIAVDKIGDRSIGAFEYITGVLHGNTGIETVQKICKTLSRKVFVDDLCSIHVHVGGMKDPKVDKPSFGTKLSVVMIKLGAKIEDSLYKMNPKSRNRNVKHVAPVERWGGITFKNFRNLLGSFLFAGDRNGRLDDSEVNNSRWDYITTSKSYGGSMSKWHGGRYKWLNLLNCHTRRGFKTFEIRMWAGSTNFEKIYNYVLISLAIVWYAENKQGLVMDENIKITIKDVVESAFAKKPAIKDMVLNFISERTKQFTTK